MKRLLALLCFCASLTGVALADSPAGNGSTTMPTAAQGAPNTYSNAWPIYFGPGGVPFQASWIPNVVSDAACHIISSSALSWGIVLINQNLSAQANSLTVFSGTTCSGAANVQYPINLGSSAYYAPPFPLAAWTTGASYKTSGALTGLVSIVWL